MQKLQDVFTAGHENAHATNEDGRIVEVTSIGNGSYLVEEQAPADLPERIKNAEAEGRHGDAYEMAFNNVRFAADATMLEYYLNDDFDVKSTDPIWTPLAVTVKA
jgi:hypothetical protein